MTHPGHLLLVSFLLSTVCTASDLPAQRTTGPAVTIDSGVIEGAYSSDNSKLVFFRGIPYAAPPIGELRWKPPEPPSPWHVVRKATELSAACPQGDFLYHAIQRTVSMVGGDPSLVQPVGVTSEDCLYLNVLTTALHVKRPQPVMLWLHGGGGTYGRGDDRFASMATKGVVVVTINYRLGVFGWVSHPELTAESPHQSSGDYGLLDQIAALKWVRQNIAKFGGDPGNVTLFGPGVCRMLDDLALGQRPVPPSDHAKRFSDGSVSQRASPGWRGGIGREIRRRECLGTNSLGSEPHLPRIASWSTRAVTTIKAYSHQVSGRFHTPSVAMRQRAIRLCAAKTAGCQGSFDFNRAAIHTASHSPANQLGT